MSPADLIAKLENTTALAKKYTGVRGFFRRVFKPWETHSAKLAVWLDIMGGDELASLYLWDLFDPDEINRLTETRAKLFKTYRKMWGKKPRTR